MKVLHIWIKTRLRVRECDYIATSFHTRTSQIWLEKKYLTLLGTNVEINSIMDMILRFKVVQNIFHLIINFFSVKLYKILESQWILRKFNKWSKFSNRDLCKYVRYDGNE